jgi:hypothetical protein
MTSLALRTGGRLLSRACFSQIATISAFNRNVVAIVPTLSQTVCCENASFKYLAIYLQRTYVDHVGVATGGPLGPLHRVVNAKHRRSSAEETRRLLPKEVEEKVLKAIRAFDRFPKDKQVRVSCFLFLVFRPTFLC